MNVVNAVALNALTPEVGGFENRACRFHPLDYTPVTGVSDELDDGRELSCHAALECGVGNGTRRRPADKSATARTLRERVPRGLTPDGSSSARRRDLAAAEYVSKQVVVELLPVGHLTSGRTRTQRTRACSGHRRRSR